MLTCRVSGEIRRVEIKSGEKNGKPWSFAVARILVADLGFAEVTIFADPSMPEPTKGSTVDLVCEVTSDAYGVKCRALEPWPVLDSAPVRLLAAELDAVPA